MATATWTTAPATAKQCETIVKMRDRKAHTPKITALLTHWDNADEARTKGIASALLDALFQADWAPRTTAAAPAAAPVTEPGMYRNAAGEVYRVQPARGTGKLYAKLLVITPDVDPEDCNGHESTDGPIGSEVFCDGSCQQPRRYRAAFDYAAGAIYKLTAADRMTTEQAREIGHEFAICCVCAAELTNPVSVAAGIGPVCGGRV